ncbi:MAG: PorP/SprF family type IX secretion system membrane protein [Chitinophagales bacterium]
MKERLTLTKHYATVPLKKVVLLLCFVVDSLFAVHGQDVHFTQFFTNPLVVNPGQTGYYDGNYRIGINARMQWPWAISNKVYNYHTEAPYVDFSFGERKIKVGWFGVGFNFLNDEAGDGRLTYRRFGLSGAYHQAFDKDHRYVLSVGAGVHYVIRSIDFSKLYFNNQWVDDFGFNLSAPNGEPLQRQSFSMVDLSAGLNMNAHVHEQVNLEFGFALLHINRPKHSFLGTTERLGFRYQANLGATYYISERLELNVNGYYTYEKKASQITLGSMLGYGFYNGRKGAVEHTIYGGLYYRIKDALAPLVGYQFRKTRLLISYDVTLSKLMAPGKANGGPEISFVHIGGWQREFGGKKVFCPSFKR